MNDADFAELGRLTNLTTLHLKESAEDMTTNGWKSLAKCQRLREITLYGIGKIGVFASINLLSQLETLNVESWPNLSEADLQAVLKLPKLKTLNVGHGAFGNREIVACSKLVNLQELDLRLNDASKMDFANAGSFKNLKKLFLVIYDGECTDDLFTSVAKIQTLESLSLPESEKYTTAGLMKLVTLKNLSNLTLPHRKMNPDEWKKAVDDLLKALPNCRITLGGEQLPLKVE